MDEFSSYPPLPHHVGAHASALPDRIAVADEHEALDYKTLSQLMLKGVECLSKNNVCVGSRVIVVCQNKIDLIAAVLSAMGAGASVLPVSPKEEDINEAIQYFKPNVVLLDRNSSHRKNIPSFQKVVAIEEFNSHKQGVLADIRPDDIGLVILTSGTTGGVRRGALLSHRALCGTAAYMNHRMELDSTVCDMVSAPLEHGFGMGRVRCALHIGGTAVFHSGLFSAPAIVDQFTQRECNMLSAAVSAMTLIIEESLEELAKSSDKLHWIELGTGHLPHHHRELLLNTFPRTRCFVSYGLTEAIRCTFLELDSERKKLDTVGKPSPGIELRIVDENGAPVNFNEEGIIEVKGVNKASGYFEQKEAWEKKQDGDWLITGDMGFVDDQGYLTYVGRTDDMINVGGFKVAPQEVEENLTELLDKTPFAVAKIPDPTGIQGFVPALFLEGNDSSKPTLDEVRDHVRKSLPNFKVPRKIYWIRQFPRTSGTKKIRRSALTEIAISLEKARLPNLKSIIKDLVKKDPGWPVFEGEIRESRRTLGEAFEAESNFDKFPNEFVGTMNMIAMSINQNPQELSRYILNWRENIPLKRGEGLALIPGILPTATVASLILHAMECKATVVWLSASASMPLAEELGILYRLRIRHIIIDASRLARWSSCESHLFDAFSYSKLERVIITGEQPESSVVSLAQEFFGIQPIMLRLTHDTWRLQPISLSRNLSQYGSISLWTELRNIAAGVFKTDASTLVRKSKPENTEGWDSLAFVELVETVETKFNISLLPRDISLIESLDDLLRILTGKIKMNAVESG